MNPPVTVVVSRHFAFPAERVFDAWLHPARLGRWMYGPAGRSERIARLGLDPRVDGGFSFVVDRQGVQVDHVGRYLEIDRPHLLVFTWGPREILPDTSRVVVELVPADDGCELSLTHVLDALRGGFADQAAGSWRRMLGALDDTLAESTPLTFTQS